jgi:predicted CopG family antitoxin
MNNNMATINVTLTTEAHQRLSKFKRPGQSFSDVVMEFVPQQNCGELLDILERKFAGKKLSDPKLLKAVRAGRGRRSKKTLRP